MEDKEKQEQILTVEMVVTVISLVWSGITITAWITGLLVWPGGHVEASLLSYIFSFICMFGAFTSPCVAFGAIALKMSKYLKVLVGLAGAAALVLLIVTYIYAAFQCF